jgi:hypothetical protein
MSFRPEDIEDLLETTLADLPKQELEYALDHNEYFWSSLFTNDNIQIDGGSSIERKVSFDTEGTAKYVGLDEVDEYKTKDTIHPINVHWSLFTANATWREFEIVNQRNSVKGYINLVQTRRDKMYIDLADMFEETMIAAPDSETDKTKPFTLPYYLSIYTDTSGTVNSSAGFLGKAVKFGDGSYSYIRAGISSNTESKWRNWCALYSAINNAFLKLCRQAMIKTKFRYPVFLKSPLIKERASKMRAIASTDTVLDLMDLVDKKDDNHVSTAKETLGGMLVNDGDLVRINKIPVIPVDTLDGASYSPIYFFDLAYFKPIVHEGYWMKVTPPQSHKPLQHTVYSIEVDGAHNILVENIRKCGFVLHKAS